MTAPRPYNLIAELTYRCPLRCPYCSNPLNHAEVRDGLSAAAWGEVFRDAAALGCLHVGLTGGEPSARADLDEIVRSAAEAGLFSHLVTSGVPIDADGVQRLADRGLRSVQLSFQDAAAADSDRIAGTASYQRKLAVARATRDAGLSLVLNIVLHRENIEHLDAILELAGTLEADRVELAHTQYHGWALRNRRSLLPTRAQVEAAGARVERFRLAHAEAAEIELVLPDYFRGRPKPCMGGWGSKAMVVTPAGRVLPCHAAESLPGLEFWSVSERPLRACWQEAPGMNAYRGLDWMPEPCRSCPEKTRDFGGCRCQAFALTGDAGATDPACDRSPRHAAVLAALEGAGGEGPPGAASGSGAVGLVYRGGREVPARSD